MNWLLIIAVSVVVLAFTKILLEINEHPTSK
jgi:hypothetical protein